MPRHRLTAVAVLALAAGPALASTTPAWAADVFVEANPNTVEAGATLNLRGSCEDNAAPATVESDAFGSVPVQPQFGFLTGAATVPADSAAGDYVVRLRCPTGTTATTVLHVLNRNRPSRGPATGFGGTAGFDSTWLLIAGGLTAIAAAAGLGLLDLRRRRVSG